jgi:transposase
MKPSEVAAKLGVSVACVRLWITRGQSCRGRRYKLQARWIGRGWETTQEWVDVFIDTTTQARLGGGTDRWAEERRQAAAVLGGR